MKNAAWMPAGIVLILWGMTSLTMGAQNPGTSGTLSPAAKDIPPLVSISLTRLGFEPEDIAIHTQKFYLMVANYTGQEDLTFILEKDKNKLSAAKIETGKFKSRYLLNLAPGRYLLREENRPNWQCHLTVDK